MSEQQSRPSGLMAGADRFEALARSVKDAQLAETRPTSSRQASSVVFAPSPDEAWARKFSSQGFGPEAMQCSDGLCVHGPVGDVPCMAFPLPEYRAFTAEAFSAFTGPASQPSVSPADFRLGPARFGAAPERQKPHRSWLKWLLFGL